MESESDSNSDSTNPNTDPSLASQGFANHSSGPIYEPVYDVSASYDGTKGEILSNSEAMGQKVFVCDSKGGNVFIITIRGDDMSGLQ